MRKSFRWAALGVAAAGLLGASTARAQVAAHAAAAESDSAELAAATAAILPIFHQMEVAANAHDADAHLAAYAKSPSILFVINDQEIHGWDALLSQQRQWWQNGKSDAVYEVVGTPEFTMLARGLVVQTYFLSSHRTGPDGSTRQMSFGVTSIWKQLPEGWRIVYAHESAVSH